MILDIIITKSNDGYTAEIPSIKGCESWAHDEESAIDKITELASFYLNVNLKSIDKARVVRNKSVYKLVFNKN